MTATKVLYGLAVLFFVLAAVGTRWPVGWQWLAGACLVGTLLL